MDYRYVTALYRSHAAAELVRQELMAIGAAHGDIHVIPETTASAQTAGLADWGGELRTLDLPPADIEEYERNLQHGDVLVSARVGVDLAPQAEEVMRRPGEFAHMHGDPMEAYRASRRAERPADADRERDVEAALGGVVEPRRI